LKQGAQQLLRDRQRTDGSVVPVLRHKECDEAQCEQNARGDKDKLGIDSEARQSPFVRDIRDHNIAESSNNQQHEYRANYERVIALRDKTDEASIDIEASVVEGGDGVKDREPRSLREVHQPDVAGKENQRTERLGNKREQGHLAHKRQKISRGSGAYRVSDEEPLPEADAPSEGKKEQSGTGHESEPANLNEEEHDGLSERRPMCACVDNHQSRYAHGGGRGEERIKEGCADASRGAGREAKHGRPNNYQRTEGIEQSYRRQGNARPRSCSLKGESPGRT